MFGFAVTDFRHDAGNAGFEFTGRQAGRNHCGNHLLERVLTHVLQSSIHRSWNTKPRVLRGHENVAEGRATCDSLLTSARVGRKHQSRVSWVCIASSGNWYTREQVAASCSGACDSCNHGGIITHGDEHANEVIVILGATLCVIELELSFCARRNVR